jgi:hypothetical protein
LSSSISRKRPLLIWAAKGDMPQPQVGHDGQEELGWVAHGACSVQ